MTQSECGTSADRSNVHRITIVENGCRIQQDHSLDVVITEDYSELAKISRVDILTIDRIFLSDELCNQLISVLRSAMTKVGKLYITGVRLGCSRALFYDLLYSFNTTYVSLQDLKYYDGYLTEELFDQPWFQSVKVLEIYDPCQMRPDQLLNFSFESIVLPNVTGIDLTTVSTVIDDWIKGDRSMTFMSIGPISDVDSGDGQGRVRNPEGVYAYVILMESSTVHQASFDQETDIQYTFTFKLVDT